MPDEQPMARLFYEDVKFTTDKARLYRFGFGKEIWVPKSLTREIDWDEKRIKIPEWFAIKYELDDYVIEE